MHIINSLQKNLPLKAGIAPSAQRMDIGMASFGMEELV